MRTIQLTDDQHAVLLAILQEFADTAPEDQHEVINEALPDQRIDVIHETWAAMYQRVHEAPKA